MSYSKKPKRILPDEVDPSVYCYDEVYDEMKDEEEKERRADESGSGSKQGSKYIQGLIETAERRNTEKELRKFKKFAKEREEAQAIGDLNDEEVYVTSAYKKKLTEMKALEEETRRRLKDEESSSMNFVKSIPRKDSRDVKGKPIACDKPSSTKTIPQEPSPVEEQEIIDTGAALVPEETSSAETKAELTGSPKPRKLRTREERLAFLEKVLAKRTVGKVFDEAVARYQARKAQAKT